MRKSILSFVLIFLFSSSLIAQENVASQENASASEKTSVQENAPVKKAPKASLDSGSIKSQFDYMMKKSSRYQEYKVIKIEWINKFHNNVTDSLNAVKVKLNESQSRISNQDAEITKLKNDLESVKNQLDETVKSKDSMKLIGIEMPKGTYNTIMWVLILGALAVAGICFMLFKRSNVVTVETKNTLEEVREEFETHRKNALVREQKLARKLQDEVIKNKNLGL